VASTPSGASGGEEAARARAAGFAAAPVPVRRGSDAPHGDVDLTEYVTPGCPHRGAQHHRCSFVIDALHYSGAQH
jgi:hypothetical protein